MLRVSESAVLGSPHDERCGSVPDLISGLMSKRKRASHKESKNNHFRSRSAAQKPNCQQQRQKIQQAPKQRKTKPSVHSLNDSHQILCVGEGNFSFARALVRLFDSSGDNLLATAYDSEETVKLKYEVFQACSLLSGHYCPCYPDSSSPFATAIAGRLRPCQQYCDRADRLWHNCFVQCRRNRSWQEPAGAELTTQH